MVNISVSDLYNNIIIALKLANIENYRMESALIIEKVTGLKKHDIAVVGSSKINDELVETANYYVNRRINGEPLQYILGEWEFYGFNFKVGQGVLIPRQDTETIIELLTEMLKDFDNPVIFDLCSGSGCIAITLDKIIKDSTVYALEISDEAVPYLTENILENNSDVRLIVGDVLDKKTRDDFKMADCIVSNPPYLTKSDMDNLQREVTFEPSRALFGGNDGLDFYREITKLWTEKLKSSGILAYEIGINQQEAVKQILEENGYKNICFKEDLCGIIRVVYGIKQ